MGIRAWFKSLFQSETATRAPQIEQHIVTARDEAAKALSAAMQPTVIVAPDAKPKARKPRAKKAPK